MAKTPITVVGTVGKAPELRYTQSGAAVCNLNVAVNKRVLDRQTNEWKDAGTSWYRVPLWREQAENVSESIESGMRVIVAGFLFLEEFTRQDGSKGTNAIIEDAAVGPDLTHATAKVTKNAPSNKGGQGQGNFNRGNGGGNDFNQSQSSAQGGWGGGNSYDEPPF